ncbi:mRNA-degrading endonuclease [Lactobacillus mellis]|nr:mRNA-degrading endonuclease [Bombilactobacillus mellis]
MTRVIYNQGDIVWINFNPTQGHEQKGRRPAIVYSLPDFQRLTGLIAVMPITTKLHRYNINIELPSELKTHVILFVSNLGLLMQMQKKEK